MGSAMSKITFPEWVAEREAAGRSKEQIARDELCVQIATLYRYLDGSRIPDRDVMRRILLLSEDRVDVACFYRLKVDAA